MCLATTTNGEVYPTWGSPSAAPHRAARRSFDNFMNSEVARIEYWDQKCQAWPSFRDAEPNAVHASVADLERAGKLAMVVTQNIDGLHTRGGTSSGRLVELHGTNTAIECMSCHARTDPDILT